MILIKEVDKIIFNFQEVANTNWQVFYCVLYAALSRRGILDKLFPASGVQYVAKYLIYRRIDIRKYIPLRIIDVARYKLKSI